MEQTENGEAGTLVFSAGRLDSGLSTNWQGEGGRKEEKGMKEEKGRERRGGGGGGEVQGEGIWILSPGGWWERKEEES